MGLDALTTLMNKTLFVLLFAAVIINLSGCSNTPAPKQTKSGNTVSIQTQSTSTQIASVTQQNFPFDLPSGWKITKEELRPDSYEADYSNDAVYNHLNFFILSNKDLESLEEKAIESFNYAMKSYDANSGQEKPLKVLKTINGIPVTIIELNTLNEGKVRASEYYFQKGASNFKVIIDDYAKNNESIIEYLIDSISTL